VLSTDANAGTEQIVNLKSDRIQTWGNIGAVNAVANRIMILPAYEHERPGNSRAALQG
jgi:hypothetical protein